MVNPSDLAFIQGGYGQPRVKGAPAGFEGVGEVVAVRVRNARSSPEERAASKRRILDAIEAGEPLRLIARRERVSLRWVQMIRQAVREAK